MGLITYENLEDGQKVTANVFNERFAQIVAQLNGNIDENNLADAGIPKEKLKAEVYESMYPIGSQYVNFTDSTNPATLLGFGTWQAVAGRVVVGYDSGQTEFNAAEKTGGEKTHTLTEAEMPAHRHSKGHVNFSAGPGPSNPSSSWAGILQNSSWGINMPDLGSGDSGYPQTGPRGGGSAHNNLQPYITAYVWKRVS